MINFNARGTKFMLPKNLLNKKPNSLLSVLSNTNLPIDDLDKSIYVNIDPNHIENIVDFYMLDLVPNMENDIFLYMDFKYIGLIDETIKKCPHIPSHMEFPLIFENICDSSLPKTNIMQKYCRIHTVDDHLIIVNLSECTCNTNYKLSSILFGFDENYLINKSDEFIDVWIGQNKNIVNNILSIYRDEINWYYYHFVKNLALSSKNLVRDHHEIPTNILIDKNNYYEFDIQSFRCLNHKSFCDFCESCYQNYDSFCNSDSDTPRNSIFDHNSTFDNSDKGKMEQYKLNSDIVDRINEIGSTVSQIHSMTKSKYSLEHYEKIMGTLIFLDMYNDDVASQLSKRYN